MTPKQIQIFCSIYFNGDAFVFPLDIDQHNTALELRNKLFDANKHYLTPQAILPRHLHLWKLLSPAHKDEEELNKIYTSLGQNDKNPYGLEKVDLDDKLINISEEQEDLIQVLAYVQLDNIFEDPSIPEPFKSSLSFKLPHRASYFNKNLDYFVLETNSVLQLSGDPPNFVLDYQKVLTQTRLYDENAFSTSNPELYLVKLRLNNALQPFDHFFTVGHEDEASRYINAAECAHYLTTLVSDTQARGDIFSDGKAPHIIALIHEISARFNTSYSSTRVLYNHTWKFPLIVNVSNGNENLCLHPRSDLEIRIAEFPFLIGEVDSGAGGSDEVRLLLHASCIVRFANHLRKSQESTPIVISAIYFDGGMKAKWHKVYQRNPSQHAVTFSTDYFDLAQSVDRFKFLHALYNVFTCAIRDSSLLKGYWEELEPAKTVIEGYHLKSLSTTNTRGSTKRKADDDGGSGSQGQGGSKRQDTRVTQNAFDQDASVGRELANAGYSLTPGLGLSRPPRWQIGLRAHQAIRSSERTVVFLKLLKCQEELAILRHFAQYTPSQNHTIALLGDFQISIGNVIVLPWQTPLWCVLEDLNSEHRFRTVVSLRSQFLEGVVFLHGHGVAHLDLKPDNIVVNNNGLSATPRLSITDFDAAEFVNGVETLITEQRGTSGWMAPEVEANKGSYSPVLADRWSCGKMVYYFAKYLSLPLDDEGAAVMDFARRLLDEDPQSRPPLDRHDQLSICLPLQRPLLLPLNPSRRRRQELAL